MPFYQILIIISINAIFEYFLIKWEINTNIDLFYALNHNLVDKEVSKYENFYSRR